MLSGSVVVELGGKVQKSPVLSDSLVMRSIPKELGLIDPSGQLLSHVLILLHSETSIPSISW